MRRGIGGWGPQTISQGRAAGGVGDVVPNGWPSDANLERGSRHIPLSNKTADLYFSTMCTALLRLTSPSLPELLGGYGRPGAVRQGVPDNSRVIRPSSASAIFVAEMTIITGFAVIFGARLSELGAHIAV